jgi:hypothetical protein
MYKTIKQKRVSKDIKDLTKLEKSIFDYLYKDFKNSFPEKKITMTIEITERIKTN